MRDRRPSHPRPRDAGLMLVEAVLCTVIVAVMLVVALQAVGAAAKARSIQVSQCQGPALARLLMSEIRQCRYSEESATPPSAPTTIPAPPGPDAGEANGVDRALFDDVDDYDGLKESPPRARDGKEIKADGTLQWKVAVVFVRPDAPQVVSPDDQGVKRITVSVTGPTGTTQLVALRSRHGAYDQVPRARTTYVSGVNVRLRLGEGGRPIHSGATLANQVGVSP